VARPHRGSFRRTPGPIPPASLIAKGIYPSATKRRHGVLVPAFAGTTYRFIIARDEAIQTFFASLDCFAFARNDVDRPAETRESSCPGEKRQARLQKSRASSSWPQQRRGWKAPRTPDGQVAQLAAWSTRISIVTAGRESFDDGTLKCWLEHDPEKHALGLDPRVDTGFPKSMPQ
jgi:hypothetical protein